MKRPSDDILAVNVDDCWLIISLNVRSDEFARPEVKYSPSDIPKSSSELPVTSEIITLNSSPDINNRSTNAILATKLVSSDSIEFISSTILSNMLEVIVLELNPRRTIDPLSNGSDTTNVEPIEIIFNLPVSTVALTSGILKSFICCAILVAVGGISDWYVVLGKPNKLNSVPPSVIVGNNVDIINLSTLMLAVTSSCKFICSAKLPNLVSVYGVAVIKPNSIAACPWIVTEGAEEVKTNTFPISCALTSADAILIVSTISVNVIVVPLWTNAIVCPLIWIDLVSSNVGDTTVPVTVISCIT